MKTRRLFGMIIMLMALVGVTAYANDDNENPMESLYGEWWLAGWSDEGSWFEVNTNYVGHYRLSIEIPKEGRVVAYSMVNEIFLGTLTLNGNELIFSGGGFMTKVGCDRYENTFFEDHIIEIKSYKLDGNSLRLYYTDEDYFLFTKYFDVSADYFPQGTKWTEIRLDTLKYDSWYSKVGDEWVPNYETIEYYVKGEHENKYWESPFKCVYTNGPEWTDSLALLIYEGKVYGYDMGILATVPVPVDDDLIPWPGEAYYFDWRVGMTVRFKDITSSNTTAIYPPGTFDFGQIEEIKEGDFGGVRPLKYTDINGVRIIQGIGVTTWNDGECLFGPVEPYKMAYTIPYEERNYRSMLVHFERNGEVLYDVWPTKETVSYTKGQMATIILPIMPDASKGKYYRLDRCEKGKIIFEEELSPKARTPYIIMPKEDFCIDLNTLDLDGLLRDTISVKGASFIGSYCHKELSCQDGFYIDIIDATPDCQADDANQRKAAVGALRAYLVAPWDDPYAQGGSRGVTVKREIVLKDNPNGIESLIPNPSPSEKGTIYDLSGRKVNSQFSILNSQLKQKGLYIKDGKKIIVK